MWYINWLGLSYMIHYSAAPTKTLNKNDKNRKHYCKVSDTSEAFRCLCLH